MREVRIGPSLAAAWLLLAVAVAAPAQCNLGCAPCTTACRPGCDGTAVTHRSGSPCGRGGAFDLTGTPYETTVPPPGRFWVYGNYLGANSGCAIAPSVFGGAGRWLLASRWDAPGIDGCLGGGARTVAESSFVDSRREGRSDHGAYYLVASVDRPFFGFDFDRVIGAPGCNPADVPVRPLGGVTLPAHGGPCVGAGRASWIAWGSNAVDCHYLDVEIRFGDPAPPWYSESGLNAAPPLIAGYEVMYATAATTLPPAEPLTSSACAGIWRPVLDPADPGWALGALPWGLDSATVTVPNSWGEDIWFATRLVYADPANPPGRYLPGSGDPRVVTPVSGHCGPIAVPLTLDIPLNATKDDGVPAAASVAPGTPLTYTIEVFNQGSPTDGRGIVVDDVLPACLDLGGFDPIADPSQVEVAGGRTVQWDPASRALQVRLDGAIPPTGSSVITVRGIAAGPDHPACCNVAAATNCRYTTGTFDAETGGNTCTRIATACGGLPPPVRGVLAARRGVEVDLTWDPPADADTVGYNLWKVTSGDKALIPLANRGGAATRPLEIEAVCLDVPLASRACTDGGAVTEPPALVYYQVRGVCADGQEGTAHPF